MSEPEIIENSACDACGNAAQYLQVTHICRACLETAGQVAGLRHELERLRDLVGVEDVASINAVLGADDEKNGR